MRTRVSLIVLLVCFGFLGAFLLAGAAPTWAGPTDGPLTVNALGDAADSAPGDGVCETAGGNSTCTLRAAIGEALAQTGPNVIIFSPSLSGVIVVNTPLPLITDTLTILGPGLENEPTVHTTSGSNLLTFGTGGPSGVGATYIVSDLTMTGNSSLALIQALNGTLTLNRVQLSGAQQALRAFGANTRVLVANSLIHDNTNGGGARGIDNGAFLVLRDSAVWNNQSIFLGGGLYNSGTAFVYNTSFYSNTVNGYSGISGMGGAIYNDVNGRLTVVNSTLSGNLVKDLGSPQGGGAGLANYGVVTLTNVTIANNTALTGLGGGLQVYTGSVALLQNSLVANSVSSSDCYNLGGTVTNGGYNLVEDNTCGFSGGADPMLGALADNGGPTLTHALLPGSPAIDAGDPAGCANPAGGVLGFDQRGYLRSVDGNADTTARCDLGAFEYLSQLLNLPLKLFLPLVVH